LASRLAAGGFDVKDYPAANFRVSDCLSPQRKKRKEKEVKEEVVLPDSSGVETSSPPAEDTAPSTGDSSVKSGEEDAALAALSNDEFSQETGEVSYDEIFDASVVSEEVVEEGPVEAEESRPLEGEPGDSRPFVRDESFDSRPVGGQFVESWPVPVESVKTGPVEEEYVAEHSDVFDDGFFAGEAVNNVAYDAGPSFADYHEEVQHVDEKPRCPTFHNEAVGDGSAFYHDMVQTGEGSATFHELLSAEEAFSNAGGMCVSGTVEPAHQQGAAEHPTVTTVGPSPTRYREPFEMFMSKNIITLETYT
jgi:hypothetical protein